MNGLQAISDWFFGLQIYLPIAAAAHSEVKNFQTSSGTQLHGQSLEHDLGGVAHEL